MTEQKTTITPQLKQIIALVPKDQNPKAYIDLIRKQIMGVDKQGNNRPLEDLYLFLYVCNKTGLDPLTRQIYAVYRWDGMLQKEKMTIQTGIDGLRLIAQRTSLYAGSDDATFEEKDGQPTKATVTVYRLNPQTGERMPITASARWSEYAQSGKDGKLMGLWGKMPYNQLAKCAEALALRKAFPNETAGLYTEDELPRPADPLADLPAPEKVEKTVEVQKSNIDITSLRKQNGNQN